MEIRYYGDKLSERIAKTPEGFLICQDVPISRTGYQEYLAKELMDDPINGNKIIPVYRPAKEVFDIRSLASFEGKPVTNEHPDEDVTPENYQKYSCGHVQNVHVGDGEDSNKVLADLYITDPTLIHLIENGKREVSCGYYAEEEKDSSGRLYQTKIRGNHVAVVRSGRAGNKVCIRDSNPLRDDSHVETLSDYIEGLRYIKDEGKKGMKKGQHVMAKDPDYLKTIATGAGVGTAVGATAGAALPVAGGAAIGHYYNKHAPEKYKKYLTTGKGAAHGLKLAPFGAIGGGWKGLKVGALAGLGAAGIQALRHRYKNRGDSDYSNYLTEDEAMENNEFLYDDDEILEDDDELMYDDDEILEDDNDEILEDDDELMYDDDEILEDDDELFIRDEGKKGMRKGQHIKAMDPEYIAALKAAKTPEARRAVTAQHIVNGGLKPDMRHQAAASPKMKKAAFAPVAQKKAQEAQKVYNSPLKRLGRFVSSHKKGLIGGAAGLAALGGAGAYLGSRKNRGDSWYHDDDELMYDDDEILLDDDMLLEDDEDILEDGCRYEDEDEILEDDDEMILEDDDELMYDDDEILEDDDEEILEDDDDVIESAKSIISDARYTLNKIKKNLRKASRRYDSEIITEDDDEILEDDDEILEDDDEILEDDDEILEDDDEILEDDDEIFEDDDEMVLEDDDEAILEDNDEILEDDDEAILEDDDEILEDDDEEILQDDDEILEDDDEEILEDDDEEVVEDEAPESEVIDTDKAAALREITEASRGITDPNERKQIQDAIYSALCGKKNQMADVMRITKKARKARMDAAFDSSSKVSLDKQQSIYDSFNPHKKTSF